MNNKTSVYGKKDLNFESLVLSRLQSIRLQTINDEFELLKFSLCQVVKPILKFKGLRQNDNFIVQ